MHLSSLYFDVISNFTDIVLPVYDSNAENFTPLKRIQASFGNSPCK